MGLKNTKETYGWLTQVLHWSWVIGSLTAFGSMYYRQYFLPEKHPTGSFLMGSVHKPVGVVVLIIACFAFAWHLFNRKPDLPQAMPNWEKIFAVFVHRCLYLFLMIMPLTGLLMSTASGRSVDVFGLFNTPLFFEENKELGSLLWQVHGIISYFGLTLIALHLGGLIKQHFRGDSVWYKMLPFLRRT